MTSRQTDPLRGIRFAVLFLLTASAPACLAQVPVFEVTPIHSSVRFDVTKSSVSINGTFHKWTADLKFKSPEPTSATLDVEIQADSVETGSGMKNNKLKSKEFFNAKENPLITFKSTKVVQTGLDTFEVDGDFTVRGVTRPEKLKLRVGRETDTISGVMLFNRKDYGMHSGMPLVHIGDHVEVTVHLKCRHVSGPPLTFKQ